MLAEACMPDEDLEALELAAQAHDALEIVRADFLAKAASANDEADECEVQASDLFARADELDVDAELFDRCTADVESAEVWAEAYRLALGEAVIAGEPESKLARIERLRDAKLRGVVSLELECATLREQAAEAARIRGEANALAARAEELRAEAVRHGQAIERLPDVLPKVVADTRARLRRLRGLPGQPRPKADSADALTDRVIEIDRGGVLRSVGGLIRR